jgi:radical SAM superfamily enzyme YgiQ (UPF0313 family)
VKVLLIYPPITRYERYSSAIGSSGGRQIPLGVLYLASYLRREGIEADVIDAEAGQLPNSAIIERIKADGIGLVGISTTTVAFHRALELAEVVKAELPKTLIVIGGPHISCQPSESMNYEVFDFAAQNEGEQTLLELVNAIESGSDFNRIKGLIFRQNGRIVVNQKRDYIEDIDSLPIPAYELIPDFKRYNPPPCNYKSKPVANIITSRGCPNQCTFCDTSVFGRKARIRSAENIVSEIELLTSRYGVKEIAFVDDTFTIRPSRIYELFELAKSKGLSFPWTCMARINNVDEKLLSFMKDNGCWHISFGIESGDEQILREIRKNIDLQNVERVIDSCHRLGILTKGFFIIGHPLETIQTIDKTINLAKRLKLDDVVVTLNTPLPGSYQYEHAAEYGRLVETDWSKFNMWNPVFVPTGLTEQVLINKHREFYRKFYLRPRIIYRYFKSFFRPTGPKRLLSLLGALRFLIEVKPK